MDNRFLAVDTSFSALAVQPEPPPQANNEASCSKDASDIAGYNGVGSPYVALFPLALPQRSAACVRWPTGWFIAIPTRVVGLGPFDGTWTAENYCFLGGVLAAIGAGLATFGFFGAKLDERGSARDTRCRGDGNTAATSLMTKT
jgi:hypothetical protein